MNCLLIHYLPVDQDRNDASKQDNPVTREIKERRPNWPKEKDEICDELRDKLKKASSTSDKQLIKQAMKFLGCDNKDRGAGDVRPR